jgi:multisubunit Na+/H+ antiporter MnhG subunit
MKEKVLALFVFLWNSILHDLLKEAAEKSEPKWDDAAVEIVDQVINSLEDVLQED